MIVLTWILCEIQKIIDPLVPIIRTELQQSIIVTSSEKEQKKMSLFVISTSVGIQCVWIMEFRLTDYVALLLL